MTKLMSIFRTKSPEELKGFTKRSEQLGIMERKVPAGAETFFDKLMSIPFKIFGKVNKDSALKDIREILTDELSDEIKRDPFYESWLSDMAMICETFCDIEGSDSIGFWLGSNRGCRRYHIDNVPQRMLVTYAGKGTEWLPDEVADREAFASGEPNEKIVKDRSAIQFLNQWDMAVFRGGPNGLLHRTPDAALNGPSILMRLDNPSFWDYFLKHQEQSGHMSL